MSCSLILSCKIPRDIGLCTPKTELLALLLQSRPISYLAFAVILKTKKTEKNNNEGFDNLHII